MIIDKELLIGQPRYDIAETLLVREIKDLFKILKGEKRQPRILYSARLCSTNEENIEISPEKQMLKELIAIRFVLRVILREVLKIRIIG